MALPMNSILEELRCLDGELFRSELTQRLYLLLKNQVQDVLGSLDVKNPARKEILKKILEWPCNLKDEEIANLKSKFGGDNDIEGLFIQVAMIYVKLSHKSNENRTLKIRHPRIEDLLKNFYHNIIKSTWGESGELWKFDPIQLDFVLREQFRKAIMDSVQVLSTINSVPSVKTTKLKRDIQPEDSISNFLEPKPKFSDTKTFFESKREREKDNDTDSYKSNSDSDSYSSVEERPKSSDRYQDSKTVLDKNNRNDQETYIQRDLSRNDTNTVIQKNVSFSKDFDEASVSSSISKVSDSSKYSSATKLVAPITKLSQTQEPIDEEDEYEKNSDDDVIRVDLH